MAATKLARVSSSRTDVAFKALESLADDKDADVRDQMHRSLAGLTPTLEIVRAVNEAAGFVTAWLVLLLVHPCNPTIMIYKTRPSRPCFICWIILVLIR